MAMMGAVMLVFVIGFICGVSVGALRATREEDARRERIRRYGNGGRA